MLLTEHKPLFRRSLTNAAPLHQRTASTVLWSGGGAGSSTTAKSGSEEAGEDKFTCTDAGLHQPRVMFECDCKCEDLLSPHMTVVPPDHQPSGVNLLGHSEDVKIRCSVAAPLPDETSQWKVSTELQLMVRWWVFVNGQLLLLLPVR